MALLSKKELKLIEFLINSKESQTKKLMSLYLKECYTDSNIIETKDYIVARGDIPIALVAHMDTVWEDYNGGKKHLYHDHRKGVLWCPEGAGFDDKIGLFLIYKILESGRRPHIVLTTQEEVGGRGAYALAAEGVCPLMDLRYCIELDRRGADDCVFYSCDNEKIEKYVETFGFKTNWGSFSDICYLCPAWGVAGVNLSVGYMDEHTQLERVYIRKMLNTLSRVKNMLDVEEVPFFEYVEMRYYSRFQEGINFTSYYDRHRVCSCCLGTYSTSSLMQVQDRDGKHKYYCINCLDDNKIGWCDYCHDPYELEQPETYDYICPTCKSKFYEENYGNYEYDYGNGDYGREENLLPPYSYETGWRDY